MEILKKIGRHLSSIVIGLGIFLVITQFGLSVKTIKDDTMEATIIDGQQFVVDKMSYKLSKPQRFDVVGVKFGNKDHYWIKRIIGLPGDKIDYINGKLYVNSSLVEEPFLAENSKTDVFRSTTLLHEQNGILPQGQYIVIGDNRGKSNDSRNPDNGTITESDILGIVRAVVYPMDKIKLL
ncbi:MAG: signal peptidase I [Culicoidibacterales bacterium]